ncbi:FkbM family methyltransferase [Falsiroseomonas sp. E2-1-a20]|uniref:FkbM family methyltransferase n=1 Tax=Falsiroseomonas sp. E2-1-a20 TaxID=3239300 RepID=UPI003F2C6BAD
MSTTREHLSTPAMATPRGARAKDAVLRALCFGLMLYFRGVPFGFGKALLWNRLVRPYILWRPMDLVARTRFGARLAGNLPDLMQGYLYFFGVWEPGITALYRAALKPGDVVVDVGANVGAHALLAAHLVGPHGRVHAVEASPFIHDRLCRNIEANAAWNIRTYNMAATDAPGPVTVFLHDASNLGGTTIVPSEATRLGAVREAVVEGRPLGQIVPEAELLAARLIKIDVEGAEWLVLRGLAPLLPRLRPDAEILLELNPAALARFGGSMDALLAMFAEAGFTAFEIANRYDTRFYIAPVATRARPFDRRPGELVDLVFRRAA